LPARFLLVGFLAFISPSQGSFVPWDLPCELPHDVGKSLSEKAIRALSLALDCRYREALSLADSVARLAPQHPSGYLLRAGIYELEMLDYGSYSGERLMDDALGEAILRAEDLLGRSEAWGSFYLGAAYGLRGLHLGRRGFWARALRDAWRGLSFLERSVRAEPSLYDSYLGIGIYRYWKSKLSWLPLVKDEKDSGVALMSLAAERGLYLRDISLLSISWALMDSGDYEGALEISEDLVVRHPDSRLLRDSLAGALKRRGDLAGAYRQYSEMFRSYRAESMEGSLGALRCLWDMAEVAFMMGNYQDCLELCSRITGADPPPGGGAGREMAGRALEKAKSYIGECGSRLR